MTHDKKVHVQHESAKNQREPKPGTPIPAQENEMPNLARLAQTRPEHLPPSAVVRLSGIAGNRAVARLVQRRSMPGPAATQPEVQRQEEEEEIQTKRLAPSITPLARVERGQVQSAILQRATVDVDEQTYKILNPVPGTSYQVVRKNWHPFGERYLYNTNSHDLLIGTPFTSDEADRLITVFGNLAAQQVGKLDKLIKNIDHARGLNIPVGVTLERMNFIYEKVRDVVMARIQADHELIRGMLNNTIDMNFGTAFASLEVSGSDPHKGGQVVVFVNYHTTIGGMAKIVYKPGDLALDRLLFGDDPTSVANQLGVSMANYKIQNLTDIGATDERERHYGYMQFVESPGPTNARQVRAVYRSFGENLAVAYVFGLRDIHQENFVLLQDKMLFIDMEAATGTFTGFAEMEMLFTPNALGTKIAEGLVGQTAAVVGGWLPDSDTLKRDVEEGFARKIGVLHSGPKIGETLHKFAEMDTRFVPFKTEDLQRLGGRFLGKLGTNARQRDITDFNTESQHLADMNGGMDDQLRADLLTLLRHQTTKDALNRGDVPFFTRHGNDVFAEDGTLLVRNMPHPRLATTQNIELNATSRRVNQTRAMEDFRRQAAPLLGSPRDRIVSEHEAARLNAGHNPP